MHFENSAAFAADMDAKDGLRSFRDKFYFPIINGKEAIYLTGNSLGLQPKTAQDAVLDEMEDWASFGVEAHVHGRKPWVSYHEQFPPLLKDIVGAKESELVVMNQLTVNLHVLFATFYRPDKKRFKILCEAKAFPSDQYAFATQAKLHGFDPDEAVIEVAPRTGEHVIDHEDIIAAIKEHGDSLALVMFSGVNYYSGQVFRMKEITEAAHAAGAYCGFDLAHAAGNIELKMHEWDVDFAAWCSYKYLNSGPGGVAGAYIHERFHDNPELPRLGGWWGHDKASRFKMDKEFRPIPTAEGWQLSNAPVLSMAAHRASLQVFNEAGVAELFKKGRQLNNYMMFVLDEINSATGKELIKLITPRNEYEKGCQVSMLIEHEGRTIFQALAQQGVICDWREPNVIRAAPVPLYNSFEDVFRFGEILQKAASQINA